MSWHPVWQLTTSQPKPARKDYAEIKLTQLPFWISVHLSEHYTNLFVSFPMNVSIVFGHLRNARLFKWLLSDMAAVRKVSKTLEFKTFFTGFLHDVVVKQRWTNCRNIKVKQIIFLASWYMIYMPVLLKIVQLHVIVGGADVLWGFLWGEASIHCICAYPINLQENCYTFSNGGG